MNRNKRICVLAVIFALVIFGVAIYYLTNNLNKQIQTQQTVTSPVTSTESENDATLNVLKDAGVDTSKIEDKSSTNSGGTILGNALPAVAYKTLAEAEETFGYYLGLHNNLESLTDYKLAGMYIINKNVMQGIYESSDGTKTITIKTSKSQTTDELIKVYSTYRLSKTIEINGVTVKISGNSENNFNLAYFNVSNGKNYSIHTDSGLAESDMNKLITELIENLQSMNDWSN